MATITLPYNLNLRPYQLPFWDSFVSKKMLRALIIWPRRNGKDLISLNALIARASQRTGLYLYAAPFYDQIRKVIWEGMDKEGRKFLDYIPKELIANVYESRMSIELINGSILRFGGADKPDSLVGGNPVGLLFTEWSLCKPYVWEILRPILAENDGWALFNCTVRGMNHVYTMAKMAEASPDWFYQYLTCEDTGIPTQESIERERRDGMPESLIRQEFYNDWSASNEETFIPLDLVKSCTETVLFPDNYNYARRIMGVDVAFSATGDDATIAKRQGRMLHPILRYKGKNNMLFASIVDHEAAQFRPDLIFIDAGRGEGVYSRLWQINKRYEEIVIPVDFGGVSSDRMYANMTSLMMGRLKNWLKQNPRPYVPLDEELIKEITAPNLEYDGAENRIRQESKKHMRARGVHSPNLLDAVKLTFAEEEADEVLSVDEQTEKENLEKYRAWANSSYDEREEYDPLNFFNRDDLPSWMNDE
jgi:hypothetical protein